MGIYWARLRLVGGSMSPEAIPNDLDTIMEKHNRTTVVAKRIDYTALPRPLRELVSLNLSFFLGGKTKLYDKLCS